MLGKLIHKLMALMKIIEIVETKLPPKSLRPLFPEPPVSSYNLDSKKASWNWHLPETSISRRSVTVYEKLVDEWGSRL